MFGFTLIVAYICGAAINSWKWIDNYFRLIYMEKQMLLHNRVDICFLFYIRYGKVHQHTNQVD